MKFFFCLLGLVLVIEGIPYFAFPDKMKKWMAIVQEMPEAQLRALGLLAMVTGTVVAYLFR